MNENKLREILLAGSEKSLFDIVLDSFVGFFGTENAVVYCIMEGRCYSLYLLFKPFIAKKVDIESKKIITNKTFLCVADRVQGLLVGGKKLVILDSCVYAPEHFNEFVSEIGVNFKDIIFKSIFISDNIIGSNILANKCEIGVMRGYSDRFWTAIMACDVGNSIITVSGVSEYLKNLAENLNTLCDYKIEKSKFELNEGFTVYDMPRTSFKKLIIDNSSIRYFCAVPKNPFGMGVNTPEDLEKAKYIQSILFSYDNGVLQFYPFVALNIDENRGELVEIYEKKYGEYFPLPDTNLNPKTKLAFERLSFLSGIEIVVDFLKAVFDTEDINSFKSFCKIENADILFNNFLFENHILNLVFYDNLPKTMGIYDKLQAKNSQVKNQKTLGDYFVESFMTVEDVEEYYSFWYDTSKIADLSAFWSNEFDEMVDYLTAIGEQLPTSIFACLKTFFTAKCEFLGYVNTTISALYFTNVCGTLMIDINGTIHIGEGACFAASRNYPYFAEIADKFNEKMGAGYAENFDKLLEMFYYFYLNYGHGGYNERYIKNILLSAKDCKARFRFARNADLTMNKYEKEMLINLSENVKEFLRYYREGKSMVKFVEEYI